MHEKFERKILKTIFVRKDIWDRPQIPYALTKGEGEYDKSMAYMF